MRTIWQIAMFIFQIQNKLPQEIDKLISSRTNSEKVVHLDRPWVSVTLTVYQNYSSDYLLKNKYSNNISEKKNMK